MLWSDFTHLRRYIGLRRLLSSSWYPSTEAHVRYNLAGVPCTIWSCVSFVYDINLGATATTIRSIRGVQIPIYLVISATDSLRRSIVLFKSLSIPTSDLKSEFLCQSSFLAQNLQTPPWITSYAWEISHALVTTYHPYCHTPSALTKYLKHKLRSQRAKRLGRSLPAQVELNVQPERNTQPLSHLSYYTLLWTTEPQNHWALAPTVTMLTLSIPRPCKVLTLGDGENLA